MEDHETAYAKLCYVVEKIPLPDNFFDVVEKYKRKELPPNQAAKECGMSRSTFYARVKEMGTYIDCQSHAWLATDDPRYTNDYIIIDITCDQFSDYDDCGHYDIPVYVGEMDGFHRRFIMNGYEVFDFSGIDSYTGPARVKLRRLYREIVGD